MPAPVNPDTRPLPSGWEERFDARKGAWFYVQRNTIPSRATYIHPSDSRFSTSTSPQSTSTSGGPDHTDPDCPVPALRLRDRDADNTPAMTTLSFAQRLYASALPSKNSPEQTGNTSVIAPNTADTAPGGAHTSSHSTGPNEARANRGSYSPPLLSLASLSLNSAENNSSTSLDTGGSFYRGPVAGQTPTRLNGDLRPKETHVHPPKTQTQPAPHSPTNTSVMNHHRASTISAPANPSMYTKPYTFTPPSEIPNRILVARPPSHASQSSTSTSLSGSWPTGTGTINQSPPPPPAKPGYSSYNSSPGAGNYSSLVSSPSSSQYSNNASQTLLPPTSYNQTQYHNCPSPSSSLTSSVQTPLTPPFTPPMANSIPTPSMNGNALLAAAGKSVLRFALGSVFGVVTPDILFSGLASSVLDAGMLDALTGSLSNLNVNSADLDLAQFQAAFQGAPGTNYQGIINSIIQQQQVSPSPGVDYQVILDALTKIHSAQAHGGGLGGSSPGLGGLVGYQPMVNAQNQQQIQALTSAIQQQAAQNAQLIQQQIQQIQNSSQPNTTHVQNYLQTAYQQQLAMSAGASTHQQQPQNSAPMLATQQSQTLVPGPHQQHSTHTSNQSVSQPPPPSQNTQNSHSFSTQHSLRPPRPPHSTGSSQTSPSISGPSNQQPSHSTIAQPSHSSTSVPRDLHRFMHPPLNSRLGLSRINFNPCDQLNSSLPDPRRSTYNHISIVSLGGRPCSSTRRIRGCSISSSSPHDHRSTNLLDRSRSITRRSNSNNRDHNLSTNILSSSSRNNKHSTTTSSSHSTNYSRVPNHNHSTRNNSHSHNISRSKGRPNLPRSSRRITIHKFTNKSRVTRRIQNRTQAIPRSRLLGTRSSREVAGPRARQARSPVCWGVRSILGPNCSITMPRTTILRRVVMGVVVRRRRDIRLRTKGAMTEEGKVGVLHSLMGS
ncbi:hypothetical protein PM082_004882 [Marasmius tenuissimus]|nr:hypothetical protein PM082_004882 [Marasmius tenuissimus]